MEPSEMAFLNIILGGKNDLIDPKHGTKKLNVFEWVSRWHLSNYREVELLIMTLSIISYFLEVLVYSRGKSDLFINLLNLI